MPHEMTIDAEGEREILLTRTFAAAQEAVFAAWTRCELLGQ